MKYLVSHQNEQIGPFGLDEIVEKVRSKQLELFDYIYDQEKDDWVLLMEFAGLASKLKSNKPTARPPQAGTGTTPDATPPAVETRFNITAHTITEWFVLKGENRFGPFTYKDVVKMLQQKVVFPFDFIWHAGMETWKRAAEIADFSEEKIRSAYSKTENKDAFMQRRFKRKKFAARVIIHDNLSLWKGHGTEISKGGVGVSMTNAMVLPGQQLTLHFHAQEGWPAFNAVCEVVSKKFVSDSSPVEYGLRFLSLSQEAQEELNKKVA